MPLDLPATWQEALEGIAAAGGVCMVIGRVDTGKTTFCGALAARALQAGLKVALVDADPGQSDIGPPAAVGLAMFDAPRDLQDLEGIPADALSFVGTTSPSGHLLQLTAAACDMVTHALAAGAQLVVVDTTGLVEGGYARALKAAKVALLRPRHIAALQRQDEVEHLLAPYRTREEPRPWRLKVSRRARARDREERRAKRERQFAAYFASARAHQLSWDDVALEQTFWLTGERVPGHIAAYVEELTEAEVVYAERVETGIFALVRDLPRASHRTIKGDELEVRAVDVALLDHLIVGLINPVGRTLAMGILTEVDFKRRRCVVAAPLASAAQVRALRLGSMRVGRDGVELGHGEIA